MVKVYSKIFILILLIELTNIGILYSQTNHDINWEIYENIFSEGGEEKTFQETEIPLPKPLKKPSKKEKECPYDYSYKRKYDKDNILLRDYFRENYRGAPREKKSIYRLPPYSKGKIIIEDEIDYGEEKVPPEYPEYIYHPRRKIKRPSWRELPPEERPRLFKHITESYLPSIGGNIGYFFFNPKDITASLDSWVGNTYGYFSKKYSSDLSDWDIKNIFVIPKDKDGKKITSQVENIYQGLSKGMVTCPMGSVFYNGNLSFKVKPSFFLQFRLGTISTLNTAYVNYTSVKDTRSKFTDENQDEKDDDPDDTEVYTKYSGNFAFKYSIETNAFPLILNGFFKYPYEQFSDTHLFTGLGLMLIPTILRVKVSGISEGIEVHIEDDYKFGKTIFGILFLQGFRLDITDWLYFDGAVSYRIAFGQGFKLKEGDYNPTKDIYFNSEYFTMSYTGFGINGGLNISF
ncbi:MAG: hypothetical protein QMD92_03045 [bacterium]|nr:hypothetical protein [bacterium]